MKAMYKNSIGWIGIIIMGMIAFSHANFLPVDTLSSPYTCGEEVSLYLDEDNDNDGMYDYWLYLRSNFRLTLENPPAYNAGQILQYNDVNNTDNTKVFYHVAEPEMLRKRDFATSEFSAIDNTTFQRLSRVFPYNQRVRGIDTQNIRVLFEQATDTGSINTVSILYKYKYKYAEDYLGGTSPYRYNPVASWADFHGLSQSEYVDWTSTKRDRSQVYTLNKCRNYELSRCGDGVTDEYVTWARANIDYFTGEICDDGVLNGTSWHCDINCGRGGMWWFCGDGIVNDGQDIAGHGPTYFSWGMEIIEECDEAELNGTDMCAEWCAFPVYDAAVDEAIDEG